MSKQTVMKHAHATLAEAEQIINGPRRGSYGAVQESFDRIAGAWSAILPIKVTASQVALCMIALKVCREANKPSHDNRVDMVGYSGLLAELEGGKV